MKHDKYNELVEQIDTVSNESEISIDVKDPKVLRLNEQLKFASIINETNELKKLVNKKPKDKLQGTIEETVTILSDIHLHHEDTDDHVKNKDKESKKTNFSRLSRLSRFSHSSKKSRESHNSRCSRCSHKHSQKKSKNKTNHKQKLKPKPKSKSKKTIPTREIKYTNQNSMQHAFNNAFNPNRQHYIANYASYPYDHDYI